MADRYQDRPYPAPDDYGRGNDPHAGRADSDPLAELARLIGQTDPFAMGRANAKPQPRAEQLAPAQPQYELPAYEDERPAGPPPWMQRANRQEAPPPQPDYYEEPEYQPSPVHPLHRYAAQQAAPQPQHAAPEPQYQQPQYQDQQYADQHYHDEQHYAQSAEPADPSRYDDALYGQIESGQDYQRDPAYPDDPYAYQNAYEEEPEDEPRKRGGLVTVAAVVALAVLGTSAAFAYRTFVGSPRSGEPPVIKADNSPTKVMPTASETAPKAPDRMALGDGGAEKLVPREETPVDVNRSGPRVVFPPLNQNANPPPPSSVAPSAAVPAAANGTLPNGEPRRIRTLTVKGDQNDAGAPANAAAPPPRPSAPAMAPAAPAPRANAAPMPPAPAQRNPASANASANGPLSLTPGAPAAAEPPARVAAVSPAAPASNGGYLVQLSSQKTEAEAQASYRALQGKFANVLGSRSPVIKRADLGEKGTVYRAFVGPFGSRDEATTFCSNLKSAGGQCFVPSN